MKRIFLYVMTLLTVGMSQLQAAAEIDQRSFVTLSEQAQSAAPKQAGVITVTEFFSFGCPWCYKIEKELTKWRRKLPKNVKFSRVPVVFERGWDVYAKAYYTAEILGISNRVAHNLFNAIQEKEQKLNTNQAMADYFIKKGVDPKIAKSAFFSSPTVDSRVRAGMQLMQLYQIRAVPAFVINGKYLVNVAAMKGDTEKLFHVLSFLVARELATTLP